MIRPLSQPLSRTRRGRVCAHSPHHLQDLCGDTTPQPTTLSLIKCHHLPLSVVVFCSAAASSYLRQAACHCWTTRSLHTLRGCAAVSPTNRLLQYHSVRRRSLKYLHTRGTFSTRSLHGTQERMADSISAGRSRICIFLTSIVTISTNLLTILATKTGTKRLITVLLAFAWQCGVVF